MKAKFRVTYTRTEVLPPLEIEVGSNRAHEASALAYQRARTIKPDRAWEIAIDALGSDGPGHVDHVESPAGQYVLIVRAPYACRFSPEARIVILRHLYAQDLVLRDWNGEPGAASLSVRLRRALAPDELAEVEALAAGAAFYTNESWEHVGRFRDNPVT